MKTIIVSTKSQSKNTLRANGQGPAEKSLSITTLAYFYADLDGEKRKYSFLDDQGRESSLVLQGTKQFDMQNKVDKHNYETLLVYLKVVPDSRISIIDKDKENKSVIETAEKSVNATAFIISLNKNDKQRLHDFVRIHTNGITGMTEDAVYAEALKIAERHPQKVLDFKKSPDSKAEILISKAIEMSIIYIDNDKYVRWSDSKNLLADSKEKLAYKIKNGDPVEKDLQTMIDLKQETLRKKVSEIDEIEAFASSLEIPSGIEISKGLEDENDEANEEIMNAVSLAVKSNYFASSSTPGKYLVPNVPDSPSLSREELYSYYKINKSHFQQMMDELKTAAIL